jgi:2,4-dienoyl-CoA reductase-like NADH-dependent reductase (Old Yellow Enzyme family)
MNFLEAFNPKTLQGTTLRNAFIKTATYEGMYEGGIPTHKLANFHASLAKGDVGLTTVSYGAISPEGRTFKDQMYIHDRSLAQLAKVVDQVHQSGGKISIQLTHCGYFTKNTENKPPLAPSRVINQYGLLVGLPFSKAMGKEDLEKVKLDFVSATRRLKSVGFDAVEIHMGHGYLLSQFLSPAVNRRKDHYGGPIENRARFPMEVLRAVREAVGPDYPLLVKLNLDDGFKGGFSMEDCKYVVKQLEVNGCSAVVLSGGFTSKTPFYLMRGEVPLKGMIENGQSLAEKWTMRLFAPLLIKKYSYTSNFFLEQAKQVRSITKMPLVYLGGVDSKNGIEEILQSGFDFIAIGRALIHDPNFLIKMKQGMIIRSACNRCNECIVEMDRGGVRCTLNH